MSHKMVQGALSELKGQNTIIERCHTSSLSALRGILDKYAVQVHSDVRGACDPAGRADARRDQDGQPLSLPVRGQGGAARRDPRVQPTLSGPRPVPLPLRVYEGKGSFVSLPPGGFAAGSDSDAAAKLLAGAGYPCGSCGGCVAALVRRMRSSAEFPHEVGLFLSYPPEDVKGFIENRAANAKCTGVWKVYGDERQARQTFAKYKKCTQVYCERWQSGSGLDKLAVADR